MGKTSFPKSFSSKSSNNWTEFGDGHNSGELLLDFEEDLGKMLFATFLSWIFDATGSNIESNLFKIKFFNEESIFRDINDDSAFGALW